MAWTRREVLSLLVLGCGRCLPALALRLSISSHTQAANPIGQTLCLLKSVLNTLRLLHAPTTMSSAASHTTSFRIYAAPQE